MSKKLYFLSVSEDSTSLDIPLTCENLPANPITNFVKDFVTFSCTFGHQGHSLKLNVRIYIWIWNSILTISCGWKNVQKVNGKWKKWKKTRHSLLPPSKNCVDIWTHWSSHLDGNKAHRSLWYGRQNEACVSLGEIL